MRPIVILAPLLPEARAIARAFHLPARFSTPFSSNKTVTVALIGLRGGDLEAVRALMPRALILAGLGGGLSPEVGVGDVVVDQRVRLERQPCRIHHGAVCSSSALVSTPAAKAALFARAGALAVDMESGIAAEFARSLGVPLLTVRAISDGAGDALDPAFLGFIDGQGRPRVSKAVAHLAGNPSKLGAMLRIGKATKVALTHLAAVLPLVVASGWPYTEEE